MKVLVLCKKFPFPARDGESIAILSVLDGLCRQGCEVRAMTMSTHKHPGRVQDVPPEWLARVNFTVVAVDTKVRPLPALINWLFRRGSYFLERFESGRYASDVMRVIHEYDPDLVQLEGAYLSPYIPVIRATSEAAVVLRLHNLEHEIWDRHIQGMTNPLAKLWLKSMIRRLKREEIQAMEQVDALIPISKADEAKVVALIGEKPMFTLLPGMHLPEIGSAPEPRQTDTICWFGALDWRPNQEGLRWFLDEVWPIIHGRQPELQLSIAGRYSPKWVQRLKMPNVTVVGEVPDAVEHYLSNEVFVVPLLSGSGIRIKLIEALSLSRAVVATTIAAEGLNARHGKEILLADSPEDFAEATLKLVNNVTLRTQIGRQGAAHVSAHFDNARNSKALLAFYESLLP